ncbi:MAG TPA: deoxyribodipyrimidine photolyase [Anaeromyxobacteraceae bacterium]|nr:deoxyribodipyrimidine photolyase [Anaeromyxobacteraceae bacterium]
MARVPSIRVRAVNDAPVRAGGRYVLYWMTAFRRAAHNFALDRAAEAAREMGRPLLVLEALRAGYPWASDRLHAFVLQGMADNARALGAAGVAYHPYVEPEPAAGRGLLSALASRAALVVADDFPSFFLARMVAVAGARLDVRLEAVDSNGLLPLAAATAVYPTAYAFRRFLQRELPRHLASFPSPRPLEGRGLAGADLPRGVASGWPAASAALLAADAAALDSLPIDHGVPPAPLHGGSAAAEETLRGFLRERLARYPERSHPDEDATSGLSPWLHFGHVSAHEIFRRLARREGWKESRLGKVTGSRAGFWGMSPEAEAFLDELVTWRELGFNMASKRADCHRYESLPRWAQETLAKHARDRREHVYRLADLTAARTHDPVWNAAQRQLLVEGRIQNYLRMLWGKKILEWSRSPREALSAMLELNDRHALDGRDPNSLSGIFWVLGRYDRPWGPERPVFGTVRYMSSENTLRKLRARAYLRRWST